MMDKIERKKPLISGVDVISGTRGTYKVMDRLGKGGRGVVYKALLITEGLHVAVKRVLRAQLTPDEEQALQYEIDLLKNLQDEYVVEYYEAIDNSASEYLDIVMEYVEGGSLEQLVKTVAKIREDPDEVGAPPTLLEERLVADFVKQILEGLRYLHEQGVIHRDIKAANILITKDRKVKLSDFGVSVKKHRASDEEDLDAVGTPYWMAPEIISLTGLSTKSDIWSLGCTIVELLTGLPPYGDLNEFAAMYHIVTDDRPPLPRDLPANLEDFLLKCFTKDLASRPEADELLRHRWILEHNDESATETLDDLSDDDEVGDNVYGKLGDQMMQSARSLAQFEEDADDFDEWEEDLGDTNEIDATEDIPSATLGGWISDSSNESDPVAELERERERRLKEQHEKVQKVALKLLDDSTTARIDACASLVALFRAQPEQKANFLGQPGLLPILENLEEPREEKVLEAMLEVLNTLLEEDAEGDEFQKRSFRRSSLQPAGPPVKDVAELLCVSGLVPVAISFCSDEHSYAVRLGAGRFLMKLMGHSSAVRVLCGCRVSRGFIDLIEEDLSDWRALEMTHIGIMGLSAVLLNADRAFFARKMCHEGAPNRIAKCIDWILLQPDNPDYDELQLEASVAMSNFASRSDPLVKAKLSEPQIVGTLVRCLDKTMSSPNSEEALELFLKSILDLSRDPQSHAPFQAAGVIQSLVRILDNYRDAYMADKTSPLQVRIMTLVMSTLNILCRVNPKRQELACVAGLVPHLQWFIMNSRLLKVWSLDLYSGLGMVSARTREELWKHDGLHFYIALIGEAGSVAMYVAKILQCLVEWLENDKLRFEKEVRRLKSTIFDEFSNRGRGSLVSRILGHLHGVESVSGADAALESLVRILQNSESLASFIISEESVRSVIAELSVTKAARRQSLMLQYIAVLIRKSGFPLQIYRESGLFEVVESLRTSDNSVVVRELAHYVAGLLSTMEAAS